MAESTFIETTAKTLPAEAAGIFVNAATELAGKGMEEAQAAHIALRQVRHAGYYNTPAGWKQLGPDVRDKINVRAATKQPDGTYAVFGVDIFHPNATKGSEEERMFTVNRIRTAIENTNRHIEAGGPPPGLTKGHPTPSQKAIGVELPVWGKCTHFSESPRGVGWARCDFVDVSPAMYDDWKAGRFIGFSSGMVCDANDLNLRFGHVAALGGDAQALPQLPFTEIYAADEQLVFSATPFIEKEQTMAKNFAACKSAYAALSSAYASAEAGEPGWEKKVEEAEAGVKLASPLEGEETPEEEALEEKLKETPMAATTEPEKKDDLAPQFAAMQAELNTAKAENKTLRQAVAGLVGKSVLAEWDGYLGGLKAKGHQFDAEAATATFKAGYDNPVVVESLKKMLEGSPVSTLTTPGATFGADGASPLGSGVAVTPANVLKVLREHGNQNHTFTAEDVKFGEVVTRKA